MELYNVLRPVFLGAAVASMLLAYFIKDDKEFSFKLLGVGVISALLMIGSAIAAKG